MKESMKRKADLKQLEDLEREVEDLRNRSRRNNLVFYNIPEKSEGDNCVAFIQGFIASHMGLETLGGYVEIEGAHRTPTQLNKNRKSPRPIHVAFLIRRRFWRMLWLDLKIIRIMEIQSELELTSQKTPKNAEKRLFLSRNIFKRS